MPTPKAYALFPLLDRDTNFTPPNGESFKQMQVRVLESLFEIDSQHADNTILLVAHSGTMAAIVAHRDGLDFGQHNISEAYEHDHILRFTVEKDRLYTLRNL